MFYGNGTVASNRTNRKNNFGKIVFYFSAIKLVWVVTVEGDFHDIKLRIREGSEQVAERQDLYFLTNVFPQAL